MGTDKRAEKVTEVWLGAIRLFFRLQAMGRELGAVTASNSSYWGLLQTLITQGPTTVPEIARLRPVSRQHIQTMANEMAANGLVEFVDNPRHKRSKLVRATKAGLSFFETQSNAMLVEAEQIVGDIPLDDLETTSEVLEQLRQALETRQSEFVD